jgi:hypothetical protein
MFTVLDAWVTVAVFVIGFSGCKPSETVSEVFVVESNCLQGLTMPADARLLDRGTLDQKVHRVTQEWRVSTARSWAEYAKAVSHDMETAYRCSSEGLPTMLCSRSLPGDSLQVELVPETRATGLVVRVRLEARPD